MTIILLGVSSHSCNVQANNRPECKHEWKVVSKTLSLQISHESVSSKSYSSDISVKKVRIVAFFAILQRVLLWKHIASHKRSCPVLPTVQQKRKHLQLP